MPVTSQIKSGLPGTIFEKLGGDDGIKTVVENTFNKVLADPNIRPFFIREGLDVEKIKLHFAAFLAHITSTLEGEWTGRPLAHAHRHYPITDEIFDAFNSHCIQAIKDTRKLRIDGIREMIKMLQLLRDVIVIKDEPQKYEVKPEEVKKEEPPHELTMQEEIGGIERIQAITMTLFELVRVDPRLSHFFQYTDIKKHACRIA